ncbi:hypothetical protein ACROYT_G028810 [Oculina patagonica]
MASKITTSSKADIGFFSSVSTPQLHPAFLEHFLESDYESEGDSSGSVVCSSIFPDKFSREQRENASEMSYEEAQDNLHLLVLERSDKEKQSIKIVRDKQRPYFCRNTAVYIMPFFLRCFNMLYSSLAKTGKSISWLDDRVILAVKTSDFGATSFMFCVY